MGTAYYIASLLTDYVQSAFLSPLAHEADKYSCCFYAMNCECFSVNGPAAMQVVCGTMGLPTATVRLKGPDGQESIGIGMGTGPVDAAYKAIDSIVKVQVGIVQG